MTKRFARRLAMPRNSLLFLLFAAILCLCACSDDSSSAKSDAKTQKFKVAVMASTSEMPRFKRTADWAQSNINKSQQGLDHKMELQLEFKNQDDADINAYMEQVAKDSDYVAIVGPTVSDKASLMAELLQESSKPMLSPKASNVVYQRRFANMPNLWNMAENDILQMETFFSHVSTSLGGLMSVSLLAPSDQRDGELVNSYTDWFGFIAEEYNLELGKLYLYKNESELRKHTREIVEQKDIFNVLLFDPSDEKMALAFDDALYQLDSIVVGRYKFFCTSNFVSDSIAKKLHYDFYRGFDLYAVPESGFSQAYHERFGEEMLHGEAHYFDALYILAYAAAYSVTTGLDLNESIKSVVEGKDGVGGDWMVAGMQRNFEALQDGRVPNMKGVSSSWTFQNRDNSVSGSVYRGWNLAKGKFVTNDYTSNDSSKHSANPEGNWLENLVAEIDTVFLEEADSNIAYVDVSERWALLVAASSGWANYRFQADIFAFYQKLKKMGYDDDHIIVIAEDDLADSERNLYPGTLRIRLDGKNVYASGVVDYKLSDISWSDLGNILTGHASERLSKVIKAKSNNNVFVFWSGHGLPGYLNFGADKIDYEQVISWIKEMPHRKMMFTVEACYSGGLGEAGEDAAIPGVFFLTAASPYETSKAAERDEEMGVYLSNYFTRGFMELLAEQPDATLRNVYIELASKISGSHVQLYNVKNYGNIYKETMSEFFVVK